MKAKAGEQAGARKAAAAAEVVEFGCVYDPKRHNGRRAQSAKARHEERQRAAAAAAAAAAAEEEEALGGRNKGKAWAGPGKALALASPQGSSGSSPGPGTGVEAPLLQVGGVATSAVRPLSAFMGDVDADDISARWERVWAALETPVLSRLALVSKYMGSGPMAQQLRPALQAWERSASLMLEKLLCQDRLEELRARLAGLGAQLEASAHVFLPRGVDEDTLDRAQLARLRLEDAAGETEYYCAALERRLSALTQMIRANEDVLAAEFGDSVAALGHDRERLLSSVRGDQAAEAGGCAASSLSSPSSSESSPEKQRSCYDDLFEEDEKCHGLTSTERRRMLCLLEEE